MAASVNKVILIGNVGRDPETRYSPSGQAVTNISLATSRKWKDKASGEMNEETEWHRVVFFGRTAEVAWQYLKKGASCYIEGYLKTRKWQDKEGRDVYTTEVVADSLQLFSQREGGSPREADKPASKPAGKPAGKSGFDDIDDDLPNF